MKWTKGNKIKKLKWNLKKIGMSILHFNYFFNIYILIIILLHKYIINVLDDKIRVEI